MSGSAGMHATLFATPDKEAATPQCHGNHRQHHLVFLVQRPRRALKCHLAHSYDLPQRLEMMDNLAREWQEAARIDAKLGAEPGGQVRRCCPREVRAEYGRR